jgi:hypothetical protein
VATLRLAFLVARFNAERTFSLESAKSASGTLMAEPAVLRDISQETLAEMIGTTRSRVNFFMNKFKKLGFIKYNGRIQINASLLSVVLHE